jgi:GTP pyrophosphokinase
MGKDVRVLVVKLADRLHNMKTLGAMPEEKRRLIARETLELYAPLANRLGMGAVRLELEDLSFAYLEPERFNELKAAVERKRANLEDTIEDIRLLLEVTLAQQGVKASVTCRVKHYFGIWRKMDAQERALDDVHDWLAYRIICADRPNCYTALGIVHGLFKPIPGRFKDYISLPKENGYQSIHTSVLMPSGDAFEIQIRTAAMHATAEAGIASHWTYKDGHIANRDEINQASFLRRMVELHQDSRDSRDLVANLKGELSFRTIQVFTPKGDLRALPEGSTPIDFAYAIHTEVGHRCVGAKVNGRMVPLRQPLSNGDRVEVLTRPDHKPSRDWLGFVKSASAKAKIQAFIREEERARAIHLGRERLEREAKAASIRLEDADIHAQLTERLKTLRHPNWDSYLAAVGFGRVSPQRLLEPFLPEPAKRKAKPAKLAIDDAIVVDDTSGILYSIAYCCKPIRGDVITGYITRNRGVAIHRADCPQLASTTLHPERRVTVTWGKGGGVFDTEITLTTEDRAGMVAAISEAVQKSGINMQRFQAASEQGTGLFHIALRVRDRSHLIELMNGLRKVRGVFTVERVKGSIFGKVQ